MAGEEIAAGELKQIEGKANNIAGAVAGDTTRQIKGKIQQVAGKAQVSFGKATRGKK
jgi:uncharacterized protein YjbJ (UPF0337 family)